MKHAPQHDKYVEVTANLRKCIMLKMHKLAKNADKKVKKKVKYAIDTLEGKQPITEKMR